MGRVLVCLGQIGACPRPKGALGYWMFWRQWRAAWSRSGHGHLQRQNNCVSQGQETNAKGALIHNTIMHVEYWSRVCRSWPVDPLSRWGTMDSRWTLIRIWIEIEEKKKMLCYWIRKKAKKIQYYTTYHGTLPWMSHSVQTTFSRKKSKPNQNRLNPSLFPPRPLTTLTPPIPPPQTKNQKATSKQNKKSWSYQPLHNPQIERRCNPMPPPGGEDASAESLPSRFIFIA